MTLFTFDDLLTRVCPGFDGHKKWKVVRHKDSRADVPDMFELSFTDAGREALDFYQSFQADHIFKDCEGIFSFVGLPQSRALFIGAYKVEGFEVVELPEADAVPEPFQTVWKRWLDEGAKDNYRYDLKRDERFSDLERRVVIDWTGGESNWHQRRLDKPVAELRDPASQGPCPDFRDIDISLAKLEHLMKHPDANSSWKDRLSSVGGIYLLTDHHNHRLYVGKADGKEGFWGRWSAYAKRDSGNVAVDEAFASGALVHEETTVSILDVVPRGPMQKKLVDRLESRWKVRLCSRVAGYNRN